MAKTENLSVLDIRADDIGKGDEGGSYLCAPNDCRRFRPATRTTQPTDDAIDHLGFRCIVRVISAS
jgi:formylglycine-generating enzyme required for sulfatase activity